MQQRGLIDRNSSWGVLNGGGFLLGGQGVLNRGGFLQGEAPSKQLQVYSIYAQDAPLLQDIARVQLAAHTVS